MDDKGEHDGKHVIFQVPECLQPLFRDDVADEGKDAEGCQFDDPAGDRSHRVVDGFEKELQCFTFGRLDMQHRHGEKDDEDENLDDLPLAQRGEDVTRNEREKQRCESVLPGCRDGSRCRQMVGRSRFYEIDDDESGRDGEGGRQEVVAEGFEAEIFQRFAAAKRNDGDENRCENERNDQHFQQHQEKVADPFETEHRLGYGGARENTESDGQNGEAFRRDDFFHDFSPSFGSCQLRL